MKLKIKCSECGKYFYFPLKGVKSRKEAKRLKKITGFSNYHKNICNCKTTCKDSFNYKKPVLTVRDRIRKLKKENFKVKHKLLGYVLRDFSKQN